MNGNWAQLGKTRRKKIGEKEKKPKGCIISLVRYMYIVQSDGTHSSAVLRIRIYKIRMYLLYSDPN